MLLAVLAVVCAAVATVRTDATSVLVVLSCLPVTASVLVPLTAPSFRPLRVRLAFALLRTSSTVPVFSPPRRTLPSAATWLISPPRVLALPSALSAVLLAVLAVVCAAVATVRTDATSVLVVLSCLPVTASVLVALTAPSFRPLRVRLAFALLRTSSTAPVFSPPRRTLPSAATWLTKPPRVLALPSALSAVLLAALAAVCAAVATVRTEATSVLVVLSCLPVTASVLVALTAPSFRPLRVRLAFALLRTSSTVPVFSPPKRTLPSAATWLSSPPSVLALPSALSAVPLAVLAVVCAAVATVRTAATSVLVVLSCLPVTASVLVALTAPSFTPLRVRLAFDLLRTSSTAPVLSPPRRTLPSAATWLTKPPRVFAFPSAVSAVFLAVLAVVCAAVATVRTDANSVLVVYSCLPVTASVLAALTAPSFTLTIFRCRLRLALPTDTWSLPVVTDCRPRATER